MTANTGAQPGRPSTSQAAARKTDCRLDIWPFKQYCKPQTSSMYCESIDEYEITEIIQNLKISKSAGPDNIGPKLIKSISHIIAKPLTHIYNLSFEIRDSTRCIENS